jgi:hypothetical protein
LEEEKSKHVGLAQQNGFGSSQLYSFVVVLREWHSNCSAHVQK